MLRLPLSAERRPLYESDMLDMNIGEAHWATRFDLIPDSALYKKTIRDYLDRIIVNIAEGRGLILFGPLGSGKTGIGVLALKEVASRGGTGYMLPVERISSIIFDHKKYDADYTVEEWINGCDLLLIDDLGREHVGEWGKSAIESLIRRRYDNRLSTIVTSNLTGKNSALTETYQACLHALKERCLSVNVSGLDWRDILSKSK